MNIDADTQPTKAHEWAAKVEQRERFVFDQNTKTVKAKRETVTYTTRIVWSDATHQLAMRYNVLPYLNELYAFSTNDNDAFGPVTETTKTEEVALEQSYVYQKFCGEEIKLAKYAGQTRGERLDALIRQFASTAAQIASAKAHLNQLRAPSPVPHPSTSDMTFGSVHEIAKVEASLNVLEQGLTKVLHKISLAISKLNDRGDVPVISDWSVMLPDVLTKVTSGNPPLPKHMVDAMFGPIRDASDAEALDDDDYESADDED